MSDVLAAEAAIRDLYAHYTDAVFRKDVAAFGDCFTENADWRIGGRIMQGRTQIMEMMERMFPRYRRIVMNFRSPLLEVGNRTANSRAYVSEQSVLADGTPYGPIGIYFDRCVEEGDRWRFAWRLFQTHYSGPPDMTGQFFDNPDFGPPPAMPPLDAESIDHTGNLKR